MREFSLYSTQSLPHTILLIFAPFRQAHQAHQAIGLPGRRASFLVEPELVWVMRTTAVKYREDRECGYTTSVGVSQPRE
jgi:hypothetical protein